MILLQSALDDGPFSHYLFDPETGIYQALKEKPAKVQERGFGDARRVGLVRHQNLFAAIYALDNQLHVAIPPSHFIWPGPWVARRRTIFNRVRSFSITSGSERGLQLSYSFVDSRYEFPGPEVIDIFFMIAERTSSPESVRTFIYFWEARARGEDVTSPAFQEELQRVQRERTQDIP